MIEEHNKLDIRLDIATRCGLARVGVWSVSGSSVSVPAFAGIQADNTPKSELPNFEMMISDRSNISDHHNNESTTDKTKLKEKGKQPKLHIYHQLNPLFESGDDVKPLEDLIEPYLMTPGTIMYPDSFAELGISLGSISAESEISEDNNGSGYIQLVTGQSEEDAFNPDTRIYILLNSLKLINNPRALVKRILSLKHREHPDKILYLPGIATTNNLAILAYLGVDIFDTCQCILQARTKTFMSSSGPLNGSSILDTQGFCDCVGCKEISKDNFEFENVLLHNIHSLYRELALVKTAISNGTLRGLVEQRMVTEPKLAALIRIMDLEQYERLEQYFPVFRSGQFLTSSRDALGRPEIIRFQNRIINRFKKPDDARVLVLLPCSAKKPYSTSKSHKFFRQAIQQATQSSGFGDASCLHEMIVTSPLGIVPRELELVYPAQQYDIPVTGHWFEDELQMIKECLIKYLSSNHYDHIVIHLPGQLGKSIEDCLKDNDDIKHRSVQKESNLDATVTPEVIRTCTSSATDKDSLNRLTKELKQLVEQYSNAGKTTRVSNKRNYQMILEGIARYQFGPVGKKLVEDCNIKGKYPYLRLLKDNVQVGMLTGERGLISLTLDGARLLVDEPDFKYKVEIDDFVPKGSIMAIGILKANPVIRVGDDVVACHNKELRAVGQAVMCGIEMENGNRGQGIKVRHHI